MNSTPSAILTALTVASALAVLPACEEKKPAASGTAGAKTQDQDAAGHHDDEGGGEHGHHGGPVIELGSAVAGPFEVSVTRDAGAITAGGDAPIDATVTVSSGATATAVAVRFWIGAEDGRGSIKAKADIEDPAEPDRWHTHAEIPDPLPEGSRLWVEIEAADGTKSVAGFDLKM